MTTGNTVLQNALREAVCAEFAAVPTEEEIDFSFSERFERRLDKIVRMQKKPYWKLVNTASKRVALVCLSVLVLSASAMSVKAVREPIVAFFKEICEGFNAYFFKGDLTETITREYRITRLPEGYVQTGQMDGAALSTVYENGEDQIDLMQAPTKHMSFVLDNEHGTVTSLSVGDISVDLYEGEGYKIAVWTYDGYFFQLTCPEKIDTATVQDMIASIR